MIDKEVKTRLILQNQSGGCGDGDDVPLSLLSVSVGCGIATDSVRSTALASQSDGTAFSRRINLIEHSVVEPRRLTWFLCRHDDGIQQT